MDRSRTIQVPVRRGPKTVSKDRLAAMVFLCLVTGACGDDDGGRASAIAFTQPAPQQLSLTGPIAIALLLPAGADPATLLVSLDGVRVDGDLTIVDDLAAGSVVVTADGAHRLAAAVEAAGEIVETDLSFETVTVVDPDHCEVLNPKECLLPYPSSRFLRTAETTSGYRLDFPVESMPQPNGARLDPEPYRGLDGFSPTGQIIMLFPGGVDPVASDAARLLPATRTTDLRSLDADSPTVLVDWETGERILHFIEPDARAADTPQRQLLFLRPLRSLTPGHRYIVAARRLLHPGGLPVAAPSTFAALRDDRPTDIAALESRREQLETIFDRLDDAGIDRDDLVLAFDFTVQSDDSLAGQLLSMRDQAFAWLDEQTAGEIQTFTVTRVVDRNCALRNTIFGREVYGTFDVPLFLGADPIASRGVPATLQVDEDGTPLRNGTMAAPFTIAIPCAAFGEDDLALPSVVRGHGLFDSNRGVIDLRVGYDALPELDLIEGATDWTGFAQPDILFFSSVVGDPALVPTLADRGRQGVLNTLVLGRMMKTAVFNRDPAFQRSDGGGLFAGPEEEMFFAGASAGGALGLAFAALSPDVTNVYVDVGGINLLGMIDRSGVALLLDEDPLQNALLIGLAQELLVRSDGAGYATHVTADPLPGSLSKNVLLTMSWLDQYSPNLSTEIAARTFGLPSLEGSLWSGVPQIVDLPGPLASAFVVYDTGAFDADNAAHAAFIPPLANLPAAELRDACEPHVLRIAIPAAAQQLQAFLRPGGRVENFCNGRCDAAEPLELPNGDDMACDPVNE